jgi:hypothetical protein
VRLSRYTVRTDLGDRQYLLYNTFTGSLAEIDPASDEILRKALDGRSLTQDEL